MHQLQRASLGSGLQQCAHALHHHTANIRSAKPARYPTKTCIIPRLLGSLAVGWRVSGSPRVYCFSNAQGGNGHQRDADHANTVQHRATGIHSSNRGSGDRVDGLSSDKASAEQQQPRPQRPQQNVQQQASDHHKCKEQQRDPGIPSFSLASHWEVSTGLGWQLKITNPLKLVFGKPWRKAVPLSILFFASTFIFTMLQSLKDGIVVHAMGADALPYLTTLGTLPASLAFFNFYRLTLVPTVPPQHLFFSTAAPFLAFYALFALVLYPLAPALQNPSWLSWLPSALPQGAAGLAAAVQQWVYSLFYVMSDLWGPVVISLAFWTVADEVCSMSEAAALYPQLGLLANLGLVGSAKFIKTVHAAAGGHMGGVLKLLVLCMLAMSAVMFACMGDIYSRHITMAPTDTHHRHSSWPHSHQQHQQQQPQLSKTSSQTAAPAVSSIGVSSSSSSSSTAASIYTSSSSSSSSSTTASTTAADSTSAAGQQQAAPHRSHSRSTPVPKASWDEIRAVFVRNPTAAALAVTVVAFSVSYRMFEYSYKHQLRLATADSAAYCLKLADVQSAVGAATIVMMLLSKYIFKHLGWPFAALISPIGMLLAGSAFFTASLLVQPAAGASTSAAASWVAATLDKLPATAGLQQLPQQELMWLALSAGFVTALASSACHNSLFTPCKQMVYKIMPAHEIKEAKAVVDLVGGQFAKSAAGWTVQALLLWSGSITGALPAMAVVYVVTILAWLEATFKLSKDMKHHEAQQATTRLREQAQQQQTVLQSKLEQLAAEQQQLGPDGELPLPKDLALASDLTSDNGDGFRAPHPTPLVTDGNDHMPSSHNKVVLDNSVQSAFTQQGLVDDAGYWNRIYRQLADNPMLLEAVVQGRAASPSQPSRPDSPDEQPLGEAQTTDSNQQQRSSRNVAGGKQALHTIFETY